MTPDLNPSEARGGVISGRIVSASTIGALVALSLLWWFFHP